MVKKSFLAGLLCAFAVASVWGQNWQHSWNDVVVNAQKEHKHILLNFSGSDWCLPCIRMHKTIFSSAAFISFSDQNLVLYNADFPRSKKNQPAKELVEQNNRLADTYNSEGHFPYTLLIDANGKVLKSWIGFYTGTVEDFIAELKID